MRQTAKSVAFQIELFPLHSPLLRESLLVSFPPLSYMLKFSGSSFLISGPILINSFITNKCSLLSIQQQQTIGLTNTPSPIHTTEMNIRVPKSRTTTLINSTNIIHMTGTSLYTLIHIVTKQ